MNKIIIWVVVVFMLLILGLSISAIINLNRARDNVSADGKLQVCPETWHQAGVYVHYGQEKMDLNNLPPPDQYMIYNGEKRNVDEFDIEWIEKNCVGKTEKYIPI